MAGDIIIRKAKKDYVCMCCGHIIPKSSEYLDRIVFLYGKPVRHDRYHDECPKLNPEEILFSKISRANGDLIAADGDGNKIHIIGIGYTNAGPKVLFRTWDGTEKLAMDWKWILDYHDEKGDVLV